MLARAVVLAGALAAFLPDDGLAQEPGRRAEVIGATLVLPTYRYDHAVLGDALEWGGIDLLLDDCPGCARTSPRRLRLTLPETRVFEDVEARVLDLDGDGLREVLVVETDLALGAALAVYDESGRRAITAFAGQPHRWLAPLGAGDLDGDGRTEIAYVDRPHLARELVLVRLSGDRLAEVGRQAGLTAHRIGETYISGGVRDCGAGAEVVLADAGWTRILAVDWREGRARQRVIADSASPADFGRAMACDG